MSSHNSRELLTRLKGYPNEMPIYIDADGVETEVYYYKDSNSCLHLWSGDVCIETVGELRVWLINRDDPESRVVCNGSVDWKNIEEIELFRDGVIIVFY